MNRRLLLAWLIGVAVVLLGLPILGWFDNTTELTPNHDRLLEACLVLAGVSGLLCGGLALRLSKHMAAGRRVLLALSFGAFASIAAGGASAYAADIVEGLIDFPSGRTTSYQSLLSISRAYQTHGKGWHWNIQTAPLWSNLDIAEKDYDFMLAHRRPADEGRNPDEISSQGYFCARVTIERSGNALRVMHAGTHTLPKGTVIICPASRR